MLKASMATRAVNGNTALVGSTEFVLHKSQQAIFNGIQKKIIDYTEQRLVRYAAHVKDQQQKLVVLALIRDYCDGKVAIAWRRGAPVYVKVTREA